MAISKMDMAAPDRTASRDDKGKERLDPNMLSSS